MKREAINGDSMPPPKQVTFKIFKHESGQIVFDFGRNLSWLALTPRQANQIADLLKQAAREN